MYAGACSRHLRTADTDFPAPQKHQSIESPAMSELGGAPSSAMPSDAGHAIMPSPPAGRVLANGVRVTGMCWFGCGDEATGNVGNKKYPKFACGPCTQSLRSLNNQCRLDRAVKAYWENIKSREESAFRRRVIMSRVCPPGSAIGVADARTRESEIAQYVQSVETEMSVINRIPVMWMLEDEYVSYHITHKRKTEEEAQAMWDAAKDNPEIRSQGTGSNRRIAVPGVPVTEALHGQRYRRAVQSSPAIDTDSAMQTANNRLAFRNQVVDFQRDFNMVGGDVFRRGAAAGSVPVMAPGDDPTAAPDIRMTLNDVHAGQLCAPATPSVTATGAQPKATTPRTQRTAYPPTGVRQTPAWEKS